MAAFGGHSKDLTNRVRELHEAITHRDAQKIESLMWPEYIFHFNSPGTRVALSPPAPRGVWLAKAGADLTNGPLLWSAVDTRIYGDFAIVVSRYHWQGAYRGQAFDYEGFITDVWLSKNGEWKLLSGNVAHISR